MPFGSIVACFRVGCIWWQWVAGTAVASCPGVLDSVSSIWNRSLSLQLLNLDWTAMLVWLWQTQAMSGPGWDLNGCHNANWLFFQLMTNRWALGMVNADLELHQRWFHMQLHKPLSTNWAPQVLHARATLCTAWLLQRCIHCLICHQQHWDTCQRTAWGTPFHWISGKCTARWPTRGAFSASQSHQAASQCCLAASQVLLLLHLPPATLRHMPERASAVGGNEWMHQLPGYFPARPACAASNWVCPCVLRCSDLHRKHQPSTSPPCEEEMRCCRVVCGPLNANVWYSTTPDATARGAETQMHTSLGWDFTIACPSPIKRCWLQKPAVSSSLNLVFV